MLVTNICIYIAKKKPIEVLHQFEKLTILTNNQVCISVITYGELLYGTHKSQSQNKALKTLESLIELIPPLPMPIEASRLYGKIRANLEITGNLIGNNDLWIAVHALSLGLILVTNNTKEFSRIDHLKLENWVN